MKCSGNGPYKKPFRDPGLRLGFLNSGEGGVAREALRQNTFSLNRLAVTALGEGKSGARLPEDCFSQPFGGHRSGGRQKRGALTTGKRDYWNQAKFLESCAAGEGGKALALSGEAAL